MLAATSPPTPLLRDSGSQSPPSLVGKGVAYILHHCQKPGLLRISKAKTPNFWFTNPVSLTLLRMVQDISYSKTRLAQMWGIHRNTVRRWVEVTTDANTPGFNRAFDQVLKLADCPHCQAEIKLNDLQYLHLKRNWLIECPKCGAGFKAEPRLKEVTDLDMKIPGRYAQVLRIVGWLINTQGVEQTKKILSDSQCERHKQIRQSIRKLLITGL